MQFISAAYAALIMNTTKNSNNIEVARVFLRNCYPDDRTDMFNAIY